MKKRTVLLTFSFALLLLGLLPGAGVAQGPGTQMVLLIDGSGSISSSNFQIMMDGIAAAVEDPDCLPHTGEVELSVVQFSATAVLEVGPTVIDSTATATTFANAVASITQVGSFTNYQAAFDLARTTITGSPNFATAGFQAINMSTDGEPNRPFGNPQGAAVTARDAAITAGVDEIDVEAINMLPAATEWIRASIVHPQPGNIAPPFTPGWVIPIPDFQTYASTLCQKFQEVVPPEINVEKSTTTATITTAGQVVPYTFLVTNAGDTALTGITVSDPNCDAAPALQSGDTNGDLNLDPTETWTYTCSHTVTQAEMDAGGNLSNAVTADSTESPPDTDAHDIPITQNAAINVEKSSTTTAITTAGQVAPYTFLVTNAGNVTLTGITVSDPNCDGALLYQSGDDGDGELQLAEIWTYTCSHTVTQAEIDAGGSLSNTVTADSTESAPDTDSHDIPITQNAMLSVQKTGTFDAGLDGFADPGELISYEFKATNTSNVTLHNVLVTDPKVATITCPSGNPIPSLAVGASETCTGSYAVTQADIDAGSVYNLATADSYESDPASDAEELMLRTPPPLEPEFVPDAGSMLLLGSGLMGLAGYASLRLRAQRKSE